MRLSFVSVMLLVGLSGCGVAEPDAFEDERREEQVVRPLTLGQVRAEEQDSTGLGELFISGDTLELRFSFGGGCAKHTLGLAWDGTFLDSGATQAELVPIHDAHGDRCLAYLMPRRRFDLTPLKLRWLERNQGEHGAIELRFARTQHTVRYEF
jgi:hypothetical protein